MTKHNSTQEIEEIELDVEELEKRIKRERLFSSSNNGLHKMKLKMVIFVATRHLDLLAVQ